MSPRTIHTFSLFDDEELGEPIPECALEQRSDEPPTAEDVANRLVDRVRQWRERNPAGNWHDIVTPPWLPYVAWRLGEKL